MASKIKADEFETLGGSGNITLNNSVTMAATKTLPAASLTGTLPDNIVDSDSYVDGSIDAAHLASNAVETAKINTAAVTSSKIANDNIDSQHYAADSIDTEHYAASSVDATALASNAVTEGKINSASVTSSKIANDAIDSQHYADGSIDTAHLADDAINEHKLASNAVVTAAINDDAITTAKINANAVGLTELAGIARGKIIYGDSGGDPAVLSAGSADQVLTSDGTDISWAAAGGGKIIGMQKVYWSQTNSSFTNQSGTNLAGGTYYPVGARIGGSYTKQQSNSHILVQGRLCLGHSGSNIHGFCVWRLGKESYYRNLGFDGRNFNWYNHGGTGAFVATFIDWFDGSTSNDVGGTGSMTFYAAPCVDGTRTHSHEINFNPHNNTYGGDQSDTPDKTTISEMIITEFEA